MALSGTPRTTIFIDERGTAAVEFALVLPILLMLVFGIIAFGQFYSQYQVFQGAAREGARVAAVRGTASDAQAATQTAAQPYTLTTSPTVAVEGGGSRCGDTTTGKKVTVSWMQTFDISLPFAPAIQKNLQIKGVFRCE